MPDDADIPNHIHLEPGKSRVVSLPQLGAGGYTWSAQVIKGAVDVEEMSPQGADPAAIGGAVKATFRLTATKPGSSVVRFAYSRPWDDSPVREQEMTVVVSG